MDAGVVGNEHRNLRPRAFAEVVVDEEVPGVSKPEPAAVALAAQNDGAVRAAVLCPQAVGHASDELSFLRFGTGPPRSRIAEVHAVVAHLEVDIAVGLADDLVAHEVFAVGKLRDDRHAGAVHAVRNGDNELLFPPGLAAVLRADDGKRLIEAPVGMRALIRKDDGDVPILVEVDEGLPNGAELVKILLDGRTAYRVARTVFPRPAVGRG